ncbi:TonB-dependent receptor family protein [Nonlabens marinus]|uniref:TonB-dependent receptor n=1 Tax=Nonlabens marinus S1-08 TaxID=1454201 RepID=W8VUB2_9FLAO|nr:TonB-dependent receptor [Nonlabens marinus]BAO54448.1 TonB-dependent receptor [Nonlabens marinus S1-08]
MHSQIDSLETVRIQVAAPVDLQNTTVDLPFSISTRNFKGSQTAKQQLSLDEYLYGIPGLFVLNRNNYSQDLRISLRGFGARSAFGIRGIKIVVDGIPETTPDGQGQIDNLTLGLIDNLQVLRGPASLLYGNAGGGVININTVSQIDSTYIEAGAVAGNFGMNKFDLTSGIKHDAGVSVISFSRTSSEGYRDFSGFETNQFNWKSAFDLKNDNNFSIQLNYTDSPFALDAGGLTLSEVKQDRRQARDRNVQFDSQEQVRQLKTGVSYDQSWGNLSLQTYGFYSYRDFDNKLPFESGGQVQLYRNYYGQGSYLTYDSQNDRLKNKFQIGYSLAFQADQRLRYDNMDGDRGALDFNQLETYNNYGFYAVDRLSIGQWNILGGLRYDINNLKAEVRSGDDNSGSQNLNSWSGSAGINYELNPSQRFFANVATSFETPALSELSSNPDGSSGFNPDLTPQKAVNYEVGFKSQESALQYSAAVFYIQTTDDLVPFEQAQFPGRTFYRNAGSTQRYGLELSATAAITQNLAVNASYTYSDFAYADYNLDGQDLEGKLLPGIPKHLASLGLTYQVENGLFLQLNTTYRGALFADDLNDAKIKDALISDLSASYPLQLGNTRFTVLGGVNNLFNSSYFDNVRINAFGGRFYEPAPGVHVYAGLRVRI